MHLKTFQQNKQTFLAYNHFRKRILSKLSPREAEVILYLVPWLLSVNEPAVPGYLPGLKRPFKVHGIESDPEIKKRIPVFRNRFGLGEGGGAFAFGSRVCVIEGLYTMGSLGTVHQTAVSDCDLWLCIDAKTFDGHCRNDLVKKVNLVKDWLDAFLRMQVYFFINDREGIRDCAFGAVDYEGSGSLQRGILKEEFYRTMIVVAGKIPLWWVCRDEDGRADYGRLLAVFKSGELGDYDFNDLGDLTAVEREEFFGAAVWQFNKALVHPLKSIIKMLTLEMLILSPRHEPLCRRFRDRVLGAGKGGAFQDPGTFTMKALLDYLKENRGEETLEFVKQCYYLRCDLKLYTKKAGVKEELLAGVLKEHPLGMSVVDDLNGFASWPLHRQIELGSRILGVMMESYRRIRDEWRETPTAAKMDDMEVIGQKLFSCLKKRPHKIPIIHKPLENLNLPALTLSYEGGRWIVSPDYDPAVRIVESGDVIYCLAYLIWNDLYRPGHLRMIPNATSVTLQEIVNLAKVIEGLFGKMDVSAVDFENFRRDETLERLLVIVSFEEAHDRKALNKFCLLFSNNRGELFLRRFQSTTALVAFLSERVPKNRFADIGLYVQRNCLQYEKIVARTKKLLRAAIMADLGED